MRIKYEANAEYGGFLEINASDFDPAIHTLFDENDKQEPMQFDQFDGMTRDQLKNYLRDANTDFAGNTGDAKLKVLCRSLNKGA